MFDLHTIRLAHLWRSQDLYRLLQFTRQTAFVVCHKSEPLRMLWRVLWYLPADSPIIVVTNAPENQLSGLKTELRHHLRHHTQIYVVHQKDEHLARAVADNGIAHLLDDTGKVRNGKGEGMYVGAWVAHQLGARWVAFYDADNQAPAILVPFTLAFSRLFQAHDADHHNIRVFWYGKPDVNSEELNHDAVGRCTRVIAPIFDQLLKAWFGEQSRQLITPNAGEQAFTMSTLAQLRFSSGFSIETFLLMELLVQAHQQQRATRLDQYLSQSPFFHTKKDDSHINRMVADSLSAFHPFWDVLPDSVRGVIHYIEQERHLTMPDIQLYPPLATLKHPLDVPQWLLP